MSSTTRYGVMRRDTKVVPMAYFQFYASITVTVTAKITLSLAIRFYVICSVGHDTVGYS